MKTKPTLPARLLMVCFLLLSVGAQAAAVFTPNSQPTGWVGEVDVSSFSFVSGIETIFKSDYIKGSWSGNVLAFPVDENGTVSFVAERWSGGLSANLDDQAFDSGRRIVTMYTNGTKGSFLWDSLSATQQNAIDNSKNKDLIGKAVVNFVRGDNSNESPNGYNYRARTSKLGDIIHSRPLFVDHPTDPRVYVGANDGMLHAIDADSGVEEFAYFPSFFITGLAANFSKILSLTTNPYTHNYYVDGTPNARAITGAGAITKVLVGGLGGGGKGLYALDISNPIDPASATEGAEAAKILWEITPTTINNAADPSYANLGYTYGIPVIAQIYNGTWAVIVGNGYNNSNGTKQAVLYIINATTGALISAIEATATASGSNGLSSVTAIDTDRDGKVDYVYAGDINGNLWKFDIRTGTPTATKIFTTSPAQPITGRVAVSYHPSGGYMVNFGTGRMFTAADSTDTTAYYAYGVWDQGTYPIDATKLVTQTLTPKSWTSGAFNYSVRVSSSSAVDYSAGTGQKTGWKMALPAGERVVGDGGLVTNSRYIFTSTNPTIAHAAVSGVAQPQGDNWLNEVDFLTGAGGTDPVFDLDASGALDDADRVRASSGTGPQTGPTGVPVSRFIASGVLSQPLVAQLDNLSQTYFNVNPDIVTSSGSSTDPGVSGGHFDFDIYYGLCTVGTTSYKCAKNTHVHEYDDKYDVTGVNMQNASLATFNLVNAIPSTATPFKILVSNQKLSPAATLLIGGNPGVRAPTYLTTAGMTMASLPTYTRADLQTLIFALPLDAFASKDWMSNGDVRAGLVPTQTGCVHSNTGGGTTGTGPWMNGALTWQIVKATTPDSAVELNMPGDPSMGYRLKKDATSQANQLAQYTTFWHHPNGKCYGASGWVKNPPQDASGSAGSSTARAVGSTDPHDGEFGISGSVATGGATTGGLALPTTTVVYNFADGSYVTQTSVKNPDGSVTVTRVYSFGDTETFTIPPISGGLESDNRAKTGRVSWREMVRP